MSLYANEKSERNRRWQKKQIAAGLCPICTRPLVPGMKRCAVCREKNRLYLKEHYRKYGDGNR